MIKITTDSTTDLPAQLLAQHHIAVLPLGIIMGGKLYQDGVNITTADSQSTAYNVYVNEASTVSGFNMSFQF